MKLITKKEILNRAREAIGVPFEQIDKSNKLKEVKGGAGKMIEEDWFDIKNNNNTEPDFKEAGIELKVTPYYFNTKGRRAKERLVCNIINYETENIDDFYNSSYWKKNETTLLMSYHDITPEINAARKKNKEQSLSNEEKYELKKQFTVDEVALFKIPENDLPIIINDWNIIANKIRENKAHELSERDTKYLAACTKGSTAEGSMRKQRDNNAPEARERAYSLKPSYMTSILNNYIYGEKEDENIIKDINKLKKVDLEGYIFDKIKPYLGKSQAELKREFNINTSSKSLNYMLISKILNVSSIDESSEFKKSGMKFKTVSVESNGKRIKQHMSFPVIKFMDIVSQDWEESDVKDQLVDTKYMFAIFKKDEEYNKLYDDYKDKQEKKIKNNPRTYEEHLFLNNIVFFQLPESDESEVKRVWLKAIEVIKNGAGLRKVKHGKGFRMRNDLPKQSESKVTHMRPHSTKSGYTKDSPYADILPNGEYMTKQCFWFNNTYIMKQIKDYIL